MAENWAVDVKKYAPDADETIISGIVRYCGIALQKRDSSLVSFSDPKELARVRTNFLKKKLGLDLADDALDAAIAKVGEQMKADRTKNRVTVYYLLAANFGKLSVFEKKAAAAKPAAGAKKAAPAKASAKPKSKAAVADAPAGVASLSSITKGVKKPAEKGEATATPPAASPVTKVAEAASPAKQETPAPAAVVNKVDHQAAEQQAASTFPRWILWVVGLVVIAWLIWFLFMRTAS